MTTPYGSAADAYRRNAILTATPEKLVVLMYDGAIRELEKARQHLETPGRTHAPEVGESIGRALSIVGELRTSLDHEKGGTVAHDLDQLYDFCLDRIYQANIERKAQVVTQAIQVLKTLKEGWDAIVPA